MNLIEAGEQCCPVEAVCFVDACAMLKMIPATSWAELCLEIEEQIGDKTEVKDVVRKEVVVDDVVVTRISEGATTSKGRVVSLGKTLAARRKEPACVLVTLHEGAHRAARSCTDSQQHR